MTLTILFRPAARAEFLAAARRYEEQRPGLGSAFVAEVERIVALAAENPGLYAVVHRNIRRVTARRFPFSVYFREEEGKIVVLAVFHGCRNPLLWQRRN